MRGDFTRTSFRPINHYSGVYLQQGRVQLDADWNEQVDIAAHRDETTSGDLIGPSGAPWVGDPFRVEPTPDETDLIIRPGRIYVDGILCELDGAWLPVSPSSSETKKVISPTGLLADGRPLLTNQWVELAIDLGAGGTGTLIARLDGVDKPARTLTLDKALPIDWVDGSNLRLRRLLTYSTQPDLPNAPAPSAGWNTLYLDVWQRHVTALDRPRLREEALGGPDTATRVQTVWQVRSIAAPAPQTGTEPVCGQHATGWKPPQTGSTGRLRARTLAAPAATECTVPANGGYRRLENQLYRVEIHDVNDSTGVITFKWSRDNASIATRVSNIDTANEILTVSDVGKDSVLRFEMGKLLELSDEPRTLDGRPGQLFQIGTVLGNQIPVTSWPDSSVGISGTYGAATAVARRWDGGGTADPDPATWQNLEDGVQIQFSPRPGVTYRPGDYWLIPARTLTAINQATTTLHGGIDWPQDGGGSPDEGAVFQGRHGTEHHHSVLALARYEAATAAANAKWKQVKDCRRRFPAATELTSFYYISGDGQEAMPGETLPKPLQVGVANGQFPVDGARVRFTILVPEEVTDRGTLDSTGAVPSSGVWVEVRTIGGVATCDHWTPSAELDQRSQQVEAELLDDLGRRTHPAIRFTANLSAARYVHFESGCPVIENTTVQEAITRVCSQQTFFYLGGDGQEGLPGEVLAGTLRVGVSTGNGPDNDGLVEFAIMSDGGGSLAAGALTGPVIEVPTVDGVAECTWTLGSARDKRYHQVMATLAPNDGQIHQPILFNANSSIAELVSYNDEKCPQKAPTVQDAIQSLCVLRQLFYIGGDGQTGSPNATLAHDLEVGITNGDGLVRVPGAVNFTVTGGGTLQATPNPDQDGIYRCRWTLGASGDQQVEARLTDTTRAVALPIRFGAEFAAESVSEPGIRVRGVVFVTPQIPIELGARYPVNRIGKGIRVLCSPRLASQTIDRATCFTTVDVPLSAIAPPPHASPNPTNAGFIPAVLAMTPRLDGTDIVLEPSNEAVAYLGNILSIIAGTAEPKELLIRLTLLGNFLWGGDEPIYLDGDSFSGPSQGKVQLRLPSGDGRRGGDFRIWFWLLPPGPFNVVFPTDVIRLLPTGGFLGGRVRLAQPLTNPMRVLLTSSRDDVTVPPVIEVPAGAAEFEVTVRAQPRAQLGPVTITLTPLEEDREGEPVIIELKVERG